MKYLNKILLLVVLFGIAGLLVVIFSGCAIADYEHRNPDGSKDRVSVRRYFWTTEQYKLTLPSGAGLEASKSSADAQSITALSGLLNTAVQTGVKLAAPAPKAATNAIP